MVLFPMFSGAKNPFLESIFSSLSSTEGAIFHPNRNLRKCFQTVEIIDKYGRFLCFLGRWVSISFTCHTDFLPHNTIRYQCYQAYFGWPHYMMIVYCAVTPMCMDSL